MKILKKVMFLAFAVFALALSSCSSDDSSDGNQTEEDYIKFKYKGTTYTFDSGYQSSGGSIQVIGMTGQDDAHKRIVLWLPINPTVGSHTVVDDIGSIGETYQATFIFMGTDNSFNATAGTIKITANNSKRIEGTFNFSGTLNGETAQVTEGKFSISQF